MTGPAAFSIETSSSGQTLLLSGPYLVSTIGPVERELEFIEVLFTEIDLAGVSEIDTAGAWLISRLAKKNGAELRGTNSRAKRLIKVVGDLTFSRSDVDEDVRWWQPIPVKIGNQVSNALTGTKGVLDFLGQILVGSRNILVDRRRFRLTAFVRQLELVGVGALPIIGLMSFLIGIVIAQQGSVQLAQFGAETLTVNLVGRITLRELGVLMTAIMVAGRSGSAFAAQIGTMKITEEIDAMRTIGISPVEALVIPRILAAIIMMPLLGFYAALMAIIGGAVVADFSLGIPFFTFIERIKEVVPLYDLWVGLIKAPVFGLIISLAGCYHGMQVTGNSEQVGFRTTLAVVSAIFAVIVLDAFFAVFFSGIGWG